MNANPTPARVAVLFGGRSSEHAVSCVSAAAVVEALEAGGFEVVPVGITRSGRFVLVPQGPAALTAAPGALPEIADPAPATTSTEIATSVSDDVAAALGSVDVVFPVLHGPWGEDGTIQGLLEMLDVAYVGSGVFASAASMDKVHMKAVFRAAGLPVGPYQVITNSDWLLHQDASIKRASALGFPLFVKPARAGSSVGITRVTTAADLVRAIEFAREHDRKIVVEAAIIGGREIECAVLEGLNGARPESSRPAEIKVRDGFDFYDFNAKYLDDGAELIVPADLPPEVATQVQELARQVFEAVDAESLARVDFFVLADNSVIVNEINTMPGFTPISMFPRLWAAEGLDYPALVKRLVEQAAARPHGLR
jgi:D-alanine-D-alanine ligase